MASEATNELERIDGFINTAARMWHAYALRIGQAYNLAYLTHTQILGRMNILGQAADRSLQNAIFSAVLTTIAGALVTRIFNPWIKDAGKEVARATFRAVMQEVAKDSTKSATRITFEQLVKESAIASQYVPNVVDPLTFQNHMFIQLDEYFTHLTTEVRWLKSNAIQNKMDILTASAITQTFETTAMLEDFPVEEDMPDINAFSKLVEIGMWWAWAEARDSKYWQKRAKIGSFVEGGAEYSYYREYQIFAPIIERLKFLDYSVYAQSVFETQVILRGYKEILLDPIKLKNIPSMRRRYRIFDPIKKQIEAYNFDNIEYLGKAYPNYMSNRTKP